MSSMIEYKASRIVLNDVWHCVFTVCENGIYAVVRRWYRDPNEPVSDLVLDWKAKRVTKVPHRFVITSISVANRRNALNNLSDGAWSKYIISTPRNFFQ